MITHLFPRDPGEWIRLVGPVSVVTNNRTYAILQTIVPGYRDRIVNIYLDEKEGGLNLNMSEDIVKALSGYGVIAGGKLIDHFCMALITERRLQ